MSTGSATYDLTQRCASSTYTDNEQSCRVFSWQAYTSATNTETKQLAAWCKTIGEEVYSDGTKTWTGFGQTWTSPTDFKCRPYEPPPEPPTAEECLEGGQLYDAATQSCVDECDNGQLNGACLSGVEDNDDCDADADDYRGELVLGYGAPPIKVCGDVDQCSGTGDANKGSIGVVNGELRCIADDYGQPACKGDSITVVDEYGFVCEPLSDTPEDEEVAEQPNTDTDGDGEPDEYQRENDPESVDKGLDKIADKLDSSNDKSDTANQHLGKIEKALSGIAKDVGSLEDMGKNGEVGGGGGSGSGDGLQNDSGEDYLADLADIKQNTKDTADTLEDIKEGPDGGYNTDTLGDAPTFTETANRLQGAITGNPTIQAVTTIPTVASNNSCPVWTFPATAYWDAIVFDAHCDILERYRGLLSAVFIAVWTLTAIVTFLRA